MSKRKICVVTGSRAEYGLLYWLMKEIKDDLALELQIVVTGMHLSAKFGSTYKVIEEDGFVINSKVDTLLSSDCAVGIAKSVGLGVIGFAETFDRLAPDIIVVLGDRFEILAAAQAAMVQKIPIAHIHGGESTLGAIDEYIRHAITKMSSLHYVAAEPYRRRVIQMGEQPDRVFVFGAPALDNLKRLRLFEKDELEKNLNFSFGSTSFLVTYHPATLGNLDPAKAFAELLKALDQYKEAKIIFTKPNADEGGSAITQMIDDYVVKNSLRAAAYASMGQTLYLSAMKHASVVIGNSSSGLIEAPSLKKPTVNVGDRQKNRLRATSVIDCAESAHSIIAAIDKAISSEFQIIMPLTVNPYGDSNASCRIKQSLKEIDIKKLIPKNFFNISYDLLN